MIMKGCDWVFSFCLHFSSLLLMVYAEHECLLVSDSKCCIQDPLCIKFLPLPPHPFFFLLNWLCTHFKFICAYCLVIHLDGFNLCFFQGFVSAVSNMRSFVPAIYDVTVALPKSSPQPTLLRMFKGQSSVVSE